MAAGDLILDSSGNEVLDGAGDLVLDGTTPCADCCSCTTYYQVKTCDETATYYVCCKGSPPAIGTVLDLGGGFTAVNFAGGHVDVGHLCLKVTSACAALPLGGKIISLPKAGPDSAVCTDQFCKPCPALCCNFTFDFAGIEVPGCLAFHTRPGPIGTGYNTKIWVRGTKVPAGKAVVNAPDGIACSLTDSNSAAAFGEADGPACSWETYYTSSNTCAVHSDPPFPTGQFGWHTTATNNCQVFYLIERTCLTVKVTIAVCAAVDDFGQRPAAGTLPYPAAFYAPGPLVPAAWFFGSATADINPAGDTVLTVPNTQTLQDPDTISTAHCLGWPIATDGHCTVTISCTPKTRYCFWKFKATCDGAGGWVVEFVESTCSPSDIDIDWTPSGPDTNPMQIKVVKSIACGGGGSCADPMDADFPDPPADASPCIVIHQKCIWLIVARVQCLDGVPAWTFSYFFRGCEDPALEPEHDWADPVTDGDGNIISMDKVVHVSGCSTFSDCSTTPPLVSDPTNPITFDPCTGVCLYHFFANKLPGVGWVVVQDPGTPICAPAGTVSTPWVDTNSSCDELFYERDVVTIGCAGGDCPPTIALPDPPGVITFPSCDICYYTFTCSISCDQPHSEISVSRGSATCGGSGSVHDWAVTSDGVLSVLCTKVVAGGACSADADCTDWPATPTPPDESVYLAELLAVCGE